MRNRCSIILVILLALFVPAVAGAVDIYLLQDTYEQPKTCDCFPCAAYCADPPKFRVFVDLEGAKKALRESSPVAAFKVSCWTFGNGKPSCQTSEMEIITAKDLREKASNWENITAPEMTGDNTRMFR